MHRRVGVVTFVLQQKLPYRRMLLATGVLIGRDGTVAADKADHTVQRNAGEESDVDGELDADA